MELDKLLMYVGEGATINAEDIEAVVTDAAALSTDAVVDAAFSGQLDTLEEQARRLFADGNNPGILLGFALRHALMLQTARGEMSDQRSASEVLKFKGIHFRRMPKVTEQLNKWPSVRLDRAVQLLGDAMLACRRSAALGDAIAVRALWSLALAVRRT
jgi:DNA polymerase III subunit delta